jgi:PAS domain S-box-containing protein
LRSAAAVPLVKEGRLVAFLYAVHSEPKHWRLEDRTILRDVAERVWAAVERARAETAVRDTEARLQSALDAADLGTFVWYVREDRTDSDIRMLRLFGLPEDGSLTLRVALDRLLHPDDREPYAEAVRRAIDPDGSGSLREDIRVQHPDGSLHWVAVTGRTVFEGVPPRAVRLIGMAADITARKSTEQALRDSEERLKESDRRKDEFLAMLAHELRNPLAPIRTGLELIRMAGDTPAAVGRVRTMMDRQVGHMVRLIDDLLDVSRITSGKIQLQRKPTALGDLVSSAVEANRAALAAAHLQLTIRIPDDPCILDVDPTRLVQVLSNLLHNAAKFTPSGGRVDLSAACIRPNGSSGAGELVLSVSDSGMGISKEVLPRVFDLFMQGEPSTGRSQPGLGIGLALARRLIEMHGGRIEATSDGPGQGSAFTLHLPIAGRIVAVDSTPARAAVEQAARRIVIIDDNEDAAHMLAMLVDELGGESFVAHDGHAGLRAVSEFRPDVVLLDIGMPGMDGYETCRRMRMEPFGTDLVIVALTGWGQEQDKQQAMDAGFDAHLTKPADPATLERILLGLPPDDSSIRSSAT